MTDRMLDTAGTKGTKDTSTEKNVNDRQEQEETPLTEWRGKKRECQERIGNDPRWDMTWKICSGCYYCHRWEADRIAQK
eukprot:1327631-Amorphochlora_amoeboformis.AAC.1